ncbi:bifunctional adenosylcobinamide kinase/adenosylcobinamide-phosphate guanylyltransferase [Nocardioides marmoriginsengisoli]|uniref:Adenosylcobinamide kinase n=1 Tax=Nocardioides marmoriginsengisoli TaxID=661483 RepID=A0A3N0CBE5_9ACTN|nr:bifunctional adenosylcobinamide kinase/adenosylcobinamide-phosphate guanylyltransferase [Nocardioides marmoriginsengisoli]RNL60770.1 bifunctional adenosylcobinamide kinase/adenosylcobinamide-phosphate guanylyltransferase [Nocardioides marmoriginsengisoli]
MRILVTGGVRSGKSAHAEALLRDRDTVTYVAPGPMPSADDAEWAARVAAHRARRPATWTTRESTDLGDLPGGSVLVDCLGTWLTAQLDELGAWEANAASTWRTRFDARLDAAVTAASTAADLVLVTNEVGLGVVPEHASGRLFRDLLGTVNQRFAAVCDEVHLVVAGRVLVL